MNLEFSSPNLQDLEQIVVSLLAEGKCACHIINQHKPRILMWKKTENGTTVYYLRIGIQKFISHEQLDRNGEIYWKFQTLKSTSEEQGEVKLETPTTDPLLNPNPTQPLNNHGESDNSEVTNSSSH